MAKAIGIDLGTTFSCVGVHNKGRVDILLNERGNKTTPSCISFTDKTRLIGWSALTQEPQNAKNTVFAVKRLMGRKYNDPIVQEDKKNFVYDVVDEGGDAAVQVLYREKRETFSPQQISAMILGRMKSIASEFLGKVVIKQAVITVPANFNNSQREATMEAGRMAGLEVLKLINEPTAAAIAYGHDRNIDNKTVLVFDLGGGTLDVTILTIKNKKYEVKVSTSNSHLGGLDFDHRMVDHLMTLFFKKHKTQQFPNDEAKDKARIRLRQACEVAKRTLSVSSEVDVYVDSFCNADLLLSITRKKFEELCADLFMQCLDPVKKALEDAKMEPKDIDDVVLVGGSTRIPFIRSLLSEHFSFKPLTQNINPDEAVAYGAAIEAAILAKQHSQEIKDIELLDVTPWSLGIAIQGIKMSVVISQYKTIPSKEVKLYTTESDNQKSVLIKVYEGENQLVINNKKLGEFEVYGIEDAKKGVPNIEVTFHLDSNSILKVTAMDQKTKATGSKKMEVRSRTGMLSDDEIERKRLENVRFEELDEDYAQRRQLRNFLMDYLEEAANNADQLTGWFKKGKLKKFIDTSLEWIEQHPEASVSQLENLKKNAKKMLSILDKFK